MEHLAGEFEEQPSAGMEATIDSQHGQTETGQNPSPSSASGSEEDMGSSSDDSDSSSVPESSSDSELGSEWDTDGDEDMEARQHHGGNDDDDGAAIDLKSVRTPYQHGPHTKNEVAVVPRPLIKQRVLASHTLVELGKVIPSPTLDFIIVQGAKVRNSAVAPVFSPVPYFIPFPLPGRCAVR